MCGARTRYEKDQKSSAEKEKNEVKRKQADKIATVSVKTKRLTSTGVESEKASLKVMAESNAFRQSAKTKQAEAKAAEAELQDLRQKSQ